MINTSAVIFRPNLRRRALFILCAVLVALSIVFAVVVPSLTLLGIVVCLVAAVFAFYFQVKSMTHNYINAPAKIDTEGGDIKITVYQAVEESGKTKNAVVTFEGGGEFALASNRRLVISPSKETFVPKNVQHAIFWKNAPNSCGYALVIAEEAWDKFVKAYEAEFVIEDEII